MRRLAIPIVPLVLVSALHAADPTPADLLKEVQDLTKDLTRENQVYELRRDVIYGYLSVNAIADAKKLCDALPKDEIDTRSRAYNALAATLAAAGKVDDAIALATALPDGQDDSEVPKLYGAIINSFAAKGDPKGLQKAAEKIPASALEKYKGFDLDVYLKTSLARAHVKAGDLKSGEAVIADVKETRFEALKVLAYLEFSRSLVAQKKTIDARKYADAARKLIEEVQIYREDITIVEMAVYALTLAGNPTGALELAQTIKPEGNKLFIIAQIVRAHLELNQITEAEALRKKFFADEAWELKIALFAATANAKRDPARAQKILTPHLDSSPDFSYCFDFGAAVAKSSNVATGLKWARSQNKTGPKANAILGVLSAYPTYRALPAYDYLLHYR